MLTRLRGLWRPSRLGDPASLRLFASREAAFLAQKSATDYCQAKAGFSARQLFSEAEFLAALEVCRWEAFGAVLADLMLVVEARLRPLDEPAPEAVLQSLVGVYREVLQSFPLPTHRPQGWAEEVKALAVRLRRAQLAQPIGAAEIALTSAQRLFAALPIHPQHRRYDEETVVNAIRFGMVAIGVKLDQRLDVSALRLALGGMA